jgi:hypothetical protein
LTVPRRSGGMPSCRKDVPDRFHKYCCLTCI